MSFDCSRFPFNPLKDYFGVVMQQGRVQLDSDWNEWLAELGRRIQAGTLDTLGRAAYPLTTPWAFKIQPVLDSSGAKHITIGPGRMYVDGLLAENHGPSPNRWDPALAEMSGTPVPPSGSPPALDFTQQPHFPGAAKLLAALAGNGPFLVYLDVWQRAVTSLEDPRLIDPAVGIDTTGRLQTAWQVNLLDLSFFGGGVVCSPPDDNIPGWPGPLSTSSGTLSTGVMQSASSGPCSVTSNTGYTGTENQLYRVEIHQPGPCISNPTLGLSGHVTGTATFKWSRDNASVTTAVFAIASVTNAAGNAASMLTVQSLGRDQILGFNPGDWIEITDDDLELSPSPPGNLGVPLPPPQPGEIHQILTVSSAEKTITLVDSIHFASPLIDGVTDPTRHTRIKRWDQAGKVYLSDGATLYCDLGAAGTTGDIPVPPPGTTLLLENGVAVTFGSSSASGGWFNTGDFWTFAARAADGCVESLNQAPPQGIHHHYAHLAIINFPDSVTDCRVPWPKPPAVPPALHVVQTNWPNDYPMEEDCFRRGLQVTLDGPPDPISVTPDTFIVTQEVPGQHCELHALAGSSVSAILHPARHHPTVCGNVITWLPEKLLPPGDCARIRVTLKGHCIWGSAVSPRRHLDGQVFGQPGGSQSDNPGGICLTLPSGGGVRASDFESWFTVVHDLRAEVRVGAELGLCAEGLNEQLDDIKIDLTGGAPTPRGQRVRCAHILVSLAPGSSLQRVFFKPSFKDAVLLIDDPVVKSASTSSSQVVTGVGGMGLDFKEGRAPNFFKGTIEKRPVEKLAPPTDPRPGTEIEAPAGSVGGSEEFLVFRDVPLDSARTGMRTLRITNIHINAAALGAGATLIAKVEIVAPRLQTSAEPQTHLIGRVQHALRTTATPLPLQTEQVLKEPLRIAATAGVNTELIYRTGGNSGIINVFLNFFGQFPNAFKPRDSTFSHLIGQADHGTQFVAHFRNVPPSLRMFVTARDVPAGNIPENELMQVAPQAEWVEEEGGAPRPPIIHRHAARGTTAGPAPYSRIPIVPVPITQGEAVAVWEWVPPLTPGSTTNQGLSFGLLLALPAGSKVRQSEPATVSLSLGPRGTEGDVARAGLNPLFKDGSAPVPLFIVSRATTES